MKNFVIRLTLALFTFTLGVWTHMAWVAYCLPDLNSHGRVICFRPERTFTCGFSR